MTTDQVNRSILVFLLCICIFLLLDCYVLPTDVSKGVVVTKTEKSVSRLRVTIYTIQTERNSLTVPTPAYENIRENDTILIARSFITHAISKISVYQKGDAYSWRIGFVPLGGLDFLVLLIVSNAVYLLFFYRKLKKAQTRRDITLFLLFLSVLFFAFYFLFE